MSSLAKKVLYIDLSRQEFEVKSHPDMNEFIGGVGLGAKLALDFGGDDFLIFSTGPLNGFFPFASKTSVLFRDGGKIQDTYLGGSLSTRLRFTGLDAIFIHGVAKEPMVLDIVDEKVSFKPVGEDVGSLGLPGKRSVLDLDENRASLDAYFEGPNNILHKILIQKNLKAMIITGSKTFDIPDRERYEELYAKILARTEDLTVEKSGKPSCSGCPMGCLYSKTGELGGDILVHSLVACTFAEKIYSDTSMVFSCLNVLGYGYTHEEIENFPKLVYDVLSKLDVGTTSHI
ncbi:hypothetical protein A2886_01405 [candidate division WWE3 bacterium RIFCSPHIGHO2_01_FULL_42_13]|uniref:Aldehyde ferredoxin oxidoreductase N-terminal domain-containing protein n=1 Tax=candidate division WWE3 bacterium RIFCSPHIGHO2_01_FULL_42_13 TaxID=1802617 RepID=A0A1F4USF3_UNCKA|nr:MAG: hypothetical protein A2886_01405 [candidate division WWE3 bacterium RIFCSPHIGHO2_01_FULL_42_13]